MPQPNYNTNNTFLLYGQYHIPLNPDYNRGLYLLNIKGLEDMSGIITQSDIIPGTHRTTHTSLEIKQRIIELDILIKNGANNPLYNSLLSVFTPNYNELESNLDYAINDLSYEFIWESYNGILYKNQKDPGHTNKLFFNFSTLTRFKNLPKGNIPIYWVLAQCIDRKLDKTVISYEQEDAAVLSLRFECSDNVIRSATKKVVIAKDNISWEAIDRTIYRTPFIEKIKPTIITNYQYIKDISFIQHGEVAAPMELNIAITSPLHIKLMLYTASENSKFFDDILAVTSIDLTKILLKWKHIKSDAFFIMSYSSEFKKLLFRVSDKNNKFVSLDYKDITQYLTPDSQWLYCVPGKHRLRIEIDQNVQNDKAVEFITLKRVEYIL